MNESYLKLPKGIKGLLIAIGLFVVLSVITALMTIALMHTPLSKMLVEKVSGAAPFLVAILVLGGVRFVLPNLSSIKNVLKDAWVFLALSIVSMAISIAGSKSGIALPANWPVKTIEVVFICLCVGIMEECMFRGVLMGGLLSVTSQSKNGQLLAIAISSLLFGCAHISFGAVVWGDPLELGQAVAKILQTGLYGFVLGISILRSRNIGSAALFHAVDDFVLLFVSMVLMGTAHDPNYVRTGSEGVQTLVVLAIMTLVYVPVAIMAAKRFKSLPNETSGAQANGTK